MERSNKQPRDGPCSRVTWTTDNKAVTRGVFCVFEHPRNFRAHKNTTSHKIFKSDQLYLLNLTKGAKFAGSVGHPMTEMLSASGGGALPPDPLTRGSAPGPTGCSSPRPPHSPWCPPTTDSFRRLCPQHPPKINPSYGLSGQAPVENTTSEYGSRYVILDLRL